MKAPFLELSDEIEREFGPLHVFRPNRDIRFAKDKTPYKTAAAAVTEGEGGAAYYVQISSAGLYVGSGYYHLAPDQLERLPGRGRRREDRPEARGRGRRRCAREATRSAHASRSSARRAAIPPTIRASSCCA